MKTTTPFPPSPETTLVIVLGASKWPYYTFFDASDAFKQAANKLRKYFLDIFGLPRKNLLWLFDTSLNALDIDKEICRHLDTFADQARDVVVYYTGQGGLTDDRTGLYLAIRDTQGHDPESSSLRLKSLARTLREKAHDQRHFYILDCCFASLGQGDLQGASIPEELAKSTLEEEDITVRGYAGLFSSGKDKESASLPTDENTYFTEALLRVLLEGSSSTGGFLSFKDVYMALEEHLLLLHEQYRSAYSRTPRPTTPQFYAGEVGSIPFFPNPQAQPSFSLPSLPPVTTAAREHRHLNVPRVMGALFCLILLVGGTILFLERQQRQQTQASLSTTPNEAINTYNTFVARNGIQFGFNPNNTRVNPYEHILSPRNVSHLKLAWAAFAGIFIYSSPAVANGIVYIGSNANGSLYAFDAGTGTPKWEVPTGNSIEWSSPAVANGVVYIGSDDHQLYAFDAVTGTPKWVARTGGSIRSSPTVVNGVVYIGSEDNKLYAFNAKSGTQLWVSAPTGGSIYSSPAVVNGVVYIGSSDDKLYAFNATTGTQLWVASTGSSIYSSPTVVNGVVYVGSDDDKLYAFDAKSGTRLWVSAPTGGYLYSSPAVVNGMVYIGSGDGKLYAFDAKSGKPKWVGSTGKGIDGKGIYSSPTVANGVVYIGSDDDKLYAFDAKSGTRLWVSAPTGDPLYTGKYSSPTVANGVVYIGSNNGDLYAFSLV